MIAKTLASQIPVIAAAAKYEYFGIKSKLSAMFRMSAPPYNGTRNFIFPLMIKCHCKRLVKKKKGSERLKI